MALDFATLDALRRHHPAWRLLMADSAPLVASFLARVFVQPNVRVMAQANLAEALEDELYALRERLGEGAFLRRAQEYHDDWAGNERAWLRKLQKKRSELDAEIARVLDGDIPLMDATAVRDRFHSSPR